MLSFFFQDFRKIFINMNVINCVMQNNILNLLTKSMKFSKHKTLEKYFCKHKVYLTKHTF